MKKRIMFVLLAALCTIGLFVDANILTCWDYHSEVAVGTVVSALDVDHQYGLTVTSNLGSTRDGIVAWPPESHFQIFNAQSDWIFYTDSGVPLADSHGSYLVVLQFGLIFPGSNIDIHQSFSTPWPQ